MGSSGDPRPTHPQRSSANGPVVTTKDRVRGSWNTRPVHSSRPPVVDPRSPEPGREDAGRTPRGALRRVLSSSDPSPDLSLAHPTPVRLGRDAQGLGSRWHALRAQVRSGPLPHTWATPPSRPVGTLLEAPDPGPDGGVSFRTCLPTNSGVQHAGNCRRRPALRGREACYSHGRIPGCTGSNLRPPS